RTLQRVRELMPVIFPLHPRTRKMIEQARLWDSLRGIRVIDPVGYLDMVMLEKSAKLIMTDSGGVQKEAFFYQVPCVTLREETEWVELVELGWNHLAPPLSTELQFKTIEISLSSLPIKGKQPYGAGDAAQKIASLIWSAYANHSKVAHSVLVS